MCEDGSHGWQGGDLTLKRITKLTYHTNGWLLHKTGSSGADMLRNTQTGPTQFDLQTLPTHLFRHSHEFVHSAILRSCTLDWFVILLLVLSSLHGFVGLVCDGTMTIGLGTPTCFQFWDIQFNSYAK